MVARHDVGDEKLVELGAKFPAVGQVLPDAVGTLIAPRWVLTTSHAATLIPKWIWADDAGWTNHGTTNVPDMRVPIIFLRPGMPGRRIARRVTTEDIGPTLAALARVKPTERLTGKVLVEVIGPDR